MAAESFSVGRHVALLLAGRAYRTMLSTAPQLFPAGQFAPGGRGAG